jgi:CPA1 family monovalent cation:H+ antiporter
VAAFETLLALLLASTALAVVARRLKMPVPVVMVLGGVGVALVPHRHLVEIEPDLAFGIFVPPLLFNGAITTSLRGLRANLRSILRLAVGLVIATTVIVALAAHTFVHALDWHGAFVLGAIVAPPDAVVALALARALRMSQRTVNVLEGETLLNDTTAFVIYRLAVRAATTGAFDLRTAIPLFLLVAAGGSVVGWVVYRIVRFMSERLEDPVLETVLLLLTPFAAYLPAEALGASGVLAVVVTGILLRRSSALLVRARSRLQGRAVYSVVEFVLNSLVFILIGTQLGEILRDPHASPIREVLHATLIVGGTVMAVRLVWVFASAYVPRLLRRFREPGRIGSFGNVAIVAWTGVRGGDSLVTALAVPHLTAFGAALPGRDLIVATTFGVILLTLLVQGLSLAPLVRWLDHTPDRSRDAEEALARRQMIAAGDTLLERRQRDGDLPEIVVERVRQKHREQSALEIALTVDDEGMRLGVLQRALEREVLRARRSAAVQLQRDQVIDDAVLHELERELDLEEVRLEENDVRDQA